MADKTPETAKTATPPQAAPAPATDGARVIKLPKPIDVEGMGRVAELRLREPVARDLYGVSLVELSASQIGAMMALGERIHSPRLPPEVWGALGLANTMAITGAVAGFFAELAQDLGLDMEGLGAPPATPNPSSTSST